MPTSNPVPSADAADLLFNAQKLDEAITSAAHTYRDRLGTNRLTLAGAVASMLGAVGVSVTVVEGDGVTDNTADVVLANAAGRPILFTGVSVIGTATTITVPIVDTMDQIFTAGSLVTIDNGLPVRPEWWGSGQNTVRYAINSLPSSGGTVQLEAKTYKPNGFVYGFGASGTYISKAGVTIRGAKMPRLAGNCKSLVDGSVIQGMLLAYADNFALENVGIDCGFDVVAEYHGGTTTAGVTEALNITYPNNAIKAAEELRKGVRLHNVIGLCRDPAALNHAIIAGEGVSDVVSSGDLIGMYGVHGIAIKCAGFRADGLTAYCNDYEGVIIKTDAQATAIATDIQIGRIYARAAGPIGWSPHATSGVGSGLILQAAGGNVDKVQIGEVNVSGYVSTVRTSISGTNIASSVNIGQIISDQAGVSGTRYGLRIEAGAGQHIDRFHVGSVEARNTDVAVLLSFPQAAANLSNHVHIGRVEATSADNAVQLASAARASIGAVITDGVTDGVFHITGTPRFTVGSVYRDTGTTVLYSTTGGGLAPALSNGWTDVGSGAEGFGVDLQGGRICLRGLIKPGSSNTFCTLPVWARPATAKRFIAQGYNGSTQVAVPILITSAGVCTVNDVAGGYANVSSWLSLAGLSFDPQG